MKMSRFTEADGTHPARGASVCPKRVGPMAMRCSSITTAMAVKERGYVAALHPLPARGSKIGRALTENGLFRTFAAAKMDDEVGRGT